MSPHDVVVASAAAVVVAVTTTLPRLSVNVQVPPSSITPDAKPLACTVWDDCWYPAYVRTTWARRADVVRGGSDATKVGSGLIVNGAAEVTAAAPALPAGPVGAAADVGPTELEAPGAVESAEMCG